MRSRIGTACSAYAQAAAAIWPTDCAVHFANATEKSPWIIKTAEIPVSFCNFPPLL